MLKEYCAEGDVTAEIEEFIKNFDPHTPFFRSHYYNIIERIAGREPLIHSTVYEGGYNVVSSFDLISKVSNKVDVFSNIQGYRVVPRSTVPPMIPDDLDGMEHDFFRRLLNPHFTPKTIANFSAGVQADIDEIMAQAKIKGHIDIATDLAQPVTGKVTMRILGFPPDDWAQYSLPIHNSAFNIGPFETRMQEGMAFARRVKEETAKLAVMDKAPGLIGYLAESSLDGRKITIDEIERIVVNLIIGGLDTTQAVTSSAAVYLGRHPERRRELAEHPERIPSAVLEFLRVFGSAPMTGRFNLTDTEIDHHHFSANEITMLFWAAGNFDPAFVERPFEVDFTRTSGRNMAFAMGPHRCLGQQLAKMELAAFISALVSMPHYHLLEDQVVAAEDIGSTFAFLNVPVSLKGD